MTQSTNECETGGGPNGNQGNHGQTNQGHPGGNSGDNCNAGGNGGNGGGDDCYAVGNGGNGGGGQQVVDCNPCDNGDYQGAVIAVNLDVNVDVSVDVAGGVLPCFDLPDICIDGTYTFRSLDLMENTTSGALHSEVPDDVA